MGAAIARRAAGPDAPARVRPCAAGERADGLRAGILDSPRGSAPRASGTEPAEPAGTQNRFARRPGADRHRDRGAVRAGTAEGAAPAAAGPALPGRAFIGLLARATHGEGDGR
ncbi:hypothetical protein Srubr_49370 [Streptomyces rubradiris]|uniref:Uncharacterized protein n=1 Tax=Streptomyces rubradiris TaxID=285531 RepID=A0ABQ3RGW8_STRRR|nr:hypothetical protein GCM10018792_58410 [Streptomyces rubradiris]GHI55091.1 hypothetical protein Srubr_49370 [Streptomyces rubradiris]